MGSVVLWALWVAGCCGRCWQRGTVGSRALWVLWAVGRCGQRGIVGAVSSGALWAAWRCGQHALVVCNLPFTSQHQREFSCSCLDSTKVSVVGGPFQEDLGGPSCGQPFMQQRWQAVPSTHHSPPHNHRGHRLWPILVSRVVNGHLVIASKQSGV